MPGGALVKASGVTRGPTSLPGGATIPGGAYITDTTGMIGALQARTSQGVNGAVPLPRDQGFWALMGPGAPLFPAPLNVPNPITGQADPRRNEYPISWNIIQNAGRLVDWTTLRNAARDIDLIAECIRVRRTEQASLDWDITLTRRAADSAGITSNREKNDYLAKHADTIGKLTDFWSEPDRINGYSWPEWLEMLMNEAMVTDATSIFPVFTYGGGLHSLRLIDGSTVQPLLDERGDRPQPPAPAYQQWLYGFPRGEYTQASDGEPDWEGTAGSLIYKPRFTRVESPYGYSPVEQCLVSAELWLRRQQWMVAEYTDGTAPRTFLKTNLSGYTPEQIRAWEDVLNDYYGGSTSRRQRLKLLPEGFDPSMVEDAAERYKPDYDEFLIKLICAHMGVQPQEIGFTPRNGLGGSGHGESQEAITYRKALRPTATWLVGIMNQISYAYLGMPRDLTFRFLGLDEEGETDADTLLEKRFRSGRATLNEARDEDGRPRYPFAEADMPMIVTERGVVFLENASTLVEPGELISPMQAPPLQAPPEGPDASGESPAPVVAERERKEARRAAAEQPKAPGSADGEDAKKAELAAYWRWAKKPRARPFEFQTVTKTDAMLHEIPLDRVVFKAADAGPKARSGHHWPGWEKDQEVARYWARELSEGLTGAIDAHALAEAWLSVRKSVIADARHWLADRLGAMKRAIGTTLRNVWTEGFYIGRQSSNAVVARAAIDWGAWKPGDPKAAAALIGDDINLRTLLDRAEVTIKSIADHRLDQLAQVLSDGLANGDSVDTLTKAVADVLDDPQWAQMVAQTETTRAMSWATQQTYLANGIAQNIWITAADQRVCQRCELNAAYGPNPVGQDFPSGQSMPPGHPVCRCALAPYFE